MLGCGRGGGHLDLFGFGLFCSKYLAEKWKVSSLLVDLTGIRCLRRCAMDRADRSAMNLDRARGDRETEASSAGIAIARAADAVERQKNSLGFFGRDPHAKIAYDDACVCRGDIKGDDDRRAGRRVARRISDDIFDGARQQRGIAEHNRPGCGPKLHLAAGERQDGLRGVGGLANVASQRTREIVLGKPSPRFAG